MYASLRRMGHIYRLLSQGAAKKYGPMVQHLSYSYTQPADNRAPPLLPLATFLNGSLFPNLTSLALAGSPAWMNAQLLRDVSRIGPNLTSLSLSGISRRIDPPTLNRLLGGCPRLCSLDLENVCVTDPMIQSLPALPHLTRLRLVCCNQITAQALDAVYAHATGLVSLALESCAGLNSPRGIFPLPASVVDLVLSNLVGVFAIDIARGLHQNVKKLDLSNMCLINGTLEFVTL